MKKTITKTDLEFLMDVAHELMLDGTASMAERELHLQAAALHSMLDQMDADAVQFKMEIGE